MSKRSTQCPTPEALAQAVSEGVSPLLQRHLRGCEPCKTYLEEEREARAWLGALPVSSLTSAQHLSARHALLAAAKGVQVAAPSASRWPKILVAAAAAVALSVGVSYWSSQRPSAVQEAPMLVTKGTVFAGDQAKFEHQTKIGDETIRLTEGSITVDVPRLKPGERFRVIVGDAEIEVRGTSFEVVAHNDKLVSVKVIHGEVEIKTERSPELVRLEPGERWVSAEHIAASETVVQEPANLPEVIAVTLPASVSVVNEPLVEVKAPPKKDPRPDALVIDDQEETFRAALASYRAGDVAAAISGFAQVSKSADPDLAEDASFWHASLLHRSKSPEARAALEVFVTRFPGSPRVYDARLLLGRLFLDVGSMEEAKRQLEEVARSGPAALQKKAQAALDAIERRATPSSSPSAP